MTAPLDDPTYEPQHLPVDGIIPDTVEKWSAASQLRWFQRFGKSLLPQKRNVWDRYYCTSDRHKGNCCLTCIEDYEEPLYDACCCKAFADD